jgi:hypothetical protein
MGAEIEVPSEGSSSRVRVQVAKVADYEIVVVVPRSDDRPPGLRPGARVIVRFFSPAGRHEALSSIVHVGSGAPLALTLSKLDALRTVQQREHFRVFAALSLELSVTESSVTNLATQSDRSATSVDISGGGMRLDTSLAPALEDRVRVALRLPAEIRQGGLAEILRAEARIVRSEALNGGERYRVALEWRFAREVERDKWVQLTLNLQRRKS